MDVDTNWWGVYAFPVGTLICFGPVLVAWVLAEMRSGEATAKGAKKQPRR
jgi:hypothetical protein